jgi:hypothetical protein
MMHSANQFVMPGFDPGIHASPTALRRKMEAWMAGTMPGHDDSEASVCV